MKSSWGSHTSKENYCACGWAADFVHDGLGAEVLMCEGDMATAFGQLPNLLLGVAAHSSTVNFQAGDVFRP